MNYEWTLAGFNDGKLRYKWFLERLPSHFLAIKVSRNSLLNFWLLCSLLSFTTSSLTGKHPRSENEKYLRMFSFNFCKYWEHDPSQGGAVELVLVSREADVPDGNLTAGRSLKSSKIFFSSSKYFYLGSFSWMLIELNAVLKSICEKHWA